MIVKLEVVISTKDSPTEKVPWAVLVCEMH